MIDKIKRVLSNTNATEEEINEYINEIIHYSDDEIYENYTDQEIIDDFKDYMG